MSFNSAVIVWCLVVPSIVACLGTLLGRWLIANRFGSTAEERPTCCSGAGGPTVAMGWWIGLLVALAARQWLTAEIGWGERLQGVEAWQSAIWLLLLFTLVPSLVSDHRIIAVRYVVAGLLATLLAFVVLPRGESWEDLLDLHRPWSALIVASVLLNTFSLDHLIASGAKLWPLLVMIAGLGPALLLVSVSYAAPAEWTLAGLAGLGGILLVAVWAAVGRKSATNHLDVAGLTAAVTLPVAGMIATAVTTARFYTWEEYPPWLYAVSLFLPSIVAVVDLPLQRWNGKIRIPVAALTSAVIIAACVWKLLLQEPTESW